MAVLETWELVLLLIPLSAITFAIIFGNLLVIIAFSTQKFLQTLSNVLLVSLAIADLSVGLFILPLNLFQIVHGGQWDFGATFCKVWLTGDMTLCTISIFNICLIAWDRYRSITDGVEYLKRRTLQSTLMKILGIWFLAIWISSPPLLGWNPDSDSDSDSDSDDDGDDKKDSTTMCVMNNNKRGFVLHSALGSLIVPTIVMITLYVKIYHTIQRRLAERSKLHALGHREVSSIILDHEATDKDANSNRNSAIIFVTPAAGETGAESCTEDETSTSNGNGNSTGNGTNLKPPTTHSAKHSMQIRNILQKRIQFSLTRERRAAKILGIIMCSFIVCWLPFSLMYIIESFLPIELKPSYLVYQSISWLGYVNSAINPIIYTIFSMDFRKAFKRLLCVKTRT